MSARKDMPSRRTVLAVALGSVLAAAAGWALLRIPRDKASATPVPLAVAETRSLEFRLSYPGASAYRPYDVKRSSQARPSEPVPLKTLSELEERGDLHGLATGYLLSGERDQAAAFLERAGSSPDTDSDRAAISLSNGALEEALILLDGALKRQPEHPQARWNRGLVLRELGLSLLAAESFSRVAALGEPGWSQEARQRADTLSRQYTERTRSYQATATAALEMITRGTTLPESAVRERPGWVRVRFHDALRSAQTPERLQELLPLAGALDRHYGGDSLVRQTRELARQDFSRRGPLARVYATLLDRTFDRSRTDGYLDQLRRAREDDLLLGALYLTGRHTHHLEEFRTLALRTGDPWFTLFAELETARGEYGRGELARAEVRLTTALAQCNQTTLRYRCAQLASLLAELTTVEHRLVEARDHALAGLRLAYQGSEVGLETQFLQHLAHVARMRNAFSLAEAYLEETVRRQPSYCPAQIYAREALASLRLFNLEPAQARRELGGAPGCEEHFSAVGALALADLARMDPRPEDWPRLKALLERLRTSGTLRPADLLLVAHIEGLALLDRDRAAGQELLRKVIAEAEKFPPEELTAKKARAYSYSALLLDAGKAGEHGRALDLFAEEIGAPSSTRCALGIELQAERRIVVARGAGGELLGSYEAGLKTPELDVATLVPAEVVSALRACTEVAVFARTPVHGRAGLLPPDLAWSYHLGRAPAAARAGAPRRLVVSDVEAPPALGLPRLRSWSSGAPPSGNLELTGAAATPSRVLEAMQEATEVEIHAHGLVNLGVSDASLVVLSPEQDGRYALTASEVKKARLRGAPVVLLAACQAAQTAPYLHEPWSLPMAFVEAGARAVIAARSDIPDAEAAEFFGAVRARIASGESPAVAVKREREVYVAGDPGSWVTAVVVFE